jgi:hypothetical protein
MDSLEIIEKKIISDVYRNRSNIRNVFYVPKAIYVSNKILFTEEYLQVIIKIIAKKVKKFRLDSKIIFFLQDEGFQTSAIKFYDKIVKYFISNYNLEATNFYHVTGAAGTEYNIQQYKEFCQNFEFTPINLVFATSFQNNTKSINENNNWKLFHTSQTKQNYSITKKFVCLNGRPRLHRLAICSEIINRDLRKDCFLSFHTLDREKNDDLENIKHALKKVFPNIFESTVQNWKQIHNELPIRLTLTENWDNMHCPNYDDMYMYRSSLFSIVNETFFFGFNNLKNKKLHDDNMITWGFGTFFTEKTWNCVKVKHPFILCSTPNALRDFRELGYKTFSPYIDETYDSVENDEKRILMIMSEVERLCNMDDKTIIDWKNKVDEICEYNYNIFLGKNNQVKIHSVGTSADNDFFDK